MEQPVLRPETGSALSLQGRQEFRPRRHVSWRGAVVPRQRLLGGPHQLQEEEARLQTAVSVLVYKDVVTGIAGDASDEICGRIPLSVSVHTIMSCSVLSAALETAASICSSAKMR